jgi:hypothetical protein
LPIPTFIDIEEDWKPYPWNDEETEVGTYDAHKIEIGKLYYAEVQFTVSNPGSFAMRLEVEYGNCKSSPPDDWCQWLCLPREE